MIFNINKIALTLILVSAFNSHSFGQMCVQNHAPNESYKWPTHTNWFFGKGQVMNFGMYGDYSPSVNTLSGAGLPFTTYESCASASDENGNLLFYSNGVRIWDGQGSEIVVPDNGGRLKTGAENATGDAGSALQGILIVKHPLRPGEYYIFTTDDAIGGTNGITYGFNYYVYNKSTNTISGATRLGTYRTTEQVAATWHNNGTDIWIVTHESTPGAPTSNYKAYLLNCNGLNSTPVTSSAGFTINLYSGFDGYSNERASLQFAETLPSARNVTAAATHHCGGGTWKPDEAVAILNFDNYNGEFTLTRYLSRNTVADSNPWDCEFSPDGSKLFVTFQSDQWSGPLLGRVGYYDVSGSSYNLLGSTSGTRDIGILKLGGDGKIYAGGFEKSPWSYLDSVTVISNPNGTPAITTKSLSTQTNSTGYGLPNMFIPPLEPLEIQNPGALTLCDLPYNFETFSNCQSSNAENKEYYENAYSTLSAQSTIDPVTGVFNTTVQGTHQIVFTLCENADTLIFEVTSCAVGIPSINNNNKLTFPNPVKNTVHLSSTFDAVKLYSENGKLIKTADNTDVLDVKHIKSGLYLVKVVKDGKEQSQRIVIE